MSKIMVFDERISNYDEWMIRIEPKDTICDYCFDYTNIQYLVYNHAFIHLFDICDKCATKYHGGREIQCYPSGEKIRVPTDPLLEYLNEIDPL